MAAQPEAAATTPKDAPAAVTPAPTPDALEKDTLLTPDPSKGAAPETKPTGQAPDNLMDEAAAEGDKEKQAEEKRLLEAKDEDLSEEEKVTKAALVKAKAEADAAKNAPEKYEFKLPEGIVADQAMIDLVTPIFKEANIPQATAQKFVDLYVQKIGEIEKAQVANWTTFVEGLRKETIASLGPDYKKELAFAARSRDRFASKELVEKLNLSGLANDKDMIALFIKVGKAISEDKVVEGKSVRQGERDHLDKLYDNPTTPKRK